MTLQNPDNPTGMFQKLILLSSVYIALVTTAIAQPKLRFLDPDKKLTQYIIENWTTDNGLPSNSLLHVFQSHDGYLWISGYNGLIRFDGLKFTVFNKSNTSAFSSDIVRKLAQDSDGNLWFTTQGSGLISYNKGVFTRHGQEQELDNLSRALCIDRTNKIWSSSPDKGWFWYENGKFNFLRHTTDLSAIEVRTILQGRTGEIWFGTMGEGLFCYKNGVLIPHNQEDGLSNLWIYSLMVDKSNQLWVGTGAGLFIFDEGKFRRVSLPFNATINALIEDDFGNVWVGTTNGLVRINSKSKTTEWLSTENGLQNNFIVDLCLDFEGTLWITNYKGGLTRIKNSKFANYTQRSGLNGKVVNAICEIEPDKILVAFDNGTLNIIEQGQIKSYTPIPALQGKRIRHILNDSDKNLWFSTYAGLLMLDNKHRETWFGTSNGLPDNQIRLTFQDSRGNVWIGTRNSGIIGKLSTGKTIAFNVTNGLMSNLVMAVQEDKQGNIWVGTSEGKGALSTIKENNGNYTSVPYEKFQRDVIFNIYCDSANDLWIAGEGGLYHIRNHQITPINKNNGLTDDTPFDVLEDNAGNLWLPCRFGIMRVSKTEALDFIEKKTEHIDCKLFNKNDGMFNQECNPTTQSVKTKNGSLYFATIEGLSQLEPSSIIFNDYIPPVVIEEVIVDNQSFMTNKNQIFSPDKKRFTFHYTALSLYEPSKVQFKYILEGFDDAWTSVGNVRSVSYTNLKEGHYTFKVLASNNDGVWNNHGASFSFQVEPYFYQTAWFYLILLALLFVITYVFVQIRIRALKLRQTRLEKIIRDRTKEIIAKNEELQKQKNEIMLINQELLQQRKKILAQSEQLVESQKALMAVNAMKDKMFSIIAHDLRGPLGNLRSILDIAMNDDGEDEENSPEKLLPVMAELTQMTFELLENLLHWSISQRGLQQAEMQLFLVDPIIEDIIKLTKSQADKKQLKINLKIPPITSVFADINMVKTVFRNLISNAIKFTRNGGVIEINSESNEKYVKFSIRDSGIGISQANQAKIFDHLANFTTFGTNQEKGSGLGLVLCRDLILKNGGHIWFESIEGEGSTFYFTLFETEEAIERINESH